MQLFLPGGRLSALDVNPCPTKGARAYADSGIAPLGQADPIVCACFMLFNLKEVRLVQGNSQSTAGSGCGDA